jgi:hypothetical protein
MISAAAAVSSSSSPGVSLSFESSKPNGETFQTTKEQNKTKKIGHFSAHSSVRFYFIFSVFVTTDLQLANWLVITSLFFRYVIIPCGLEKSGGLFIYFPGKKKK